MFAGPNGSGKSSLKEVLPAELLGIYLNADEIEANLRRGFLNLSPYNLGALAEQIPDLLRHASALRLLQPGQDLSGLKVEGDTLYLRGAKPDSYLASSLSEIMRSHLMSQGVSFTFETVMSHKGKVEELAKAQSLGYRTYLYYIATEDPLINISRVENRVRLGGHPVLSEKIESRYYRSLNLLPQAVAHSNRAYLFDNSNEGSQHTWVAEITNGRSLQLVTEEIPIWVRRFVIEQMPG